MKWTSLLWNSMNLSWFWSLGSKIYTVFTIWISLKTNKPPNTNSDCNCGDGPDMARRWHLFHISVHFCLRTDWTIFFALLCLTFLSASSFKLTDYNLNFPHGSKTLSVLSHKVWLNGPLLMSKNLFFSLFLYESFWILNPFQAGCLKVNIYSS